MTEEENAGAAGTDVMLFADGACSGNPGPGGWGTVLKCPGLDAEKHLSGAQANTTNNRMELTAVIEGLRALKKPCRVVVTTDSRYVVDAFQKGWLANWRRNGWRTASKQPVKNEDLWRELMDAMQPHRVSWEWIRGHAGHAENELADSLAVKARLGLRGSGAPGNLRTTPGSALSSQHFPDTDACLLAGQPAQ